MSGFAPIFVVGCQRSGTTALAVMLDRHSQVASLPETQFYYRFVRDDSGPMTREALVDRALADRDVAAAGLDRAEVLAHLGALPATHTGLFQALLEAYAARHGATRPCEKSCHHLFAAPELLAQWPDARVICIVRDGRDVVDSLCRVEWTHRLEPIHAFQWNEFAAAADRLRQQLDPSRFKVVSFEELMRAPEETLRALCGFLELPFEPGQLAAGASSGTIPATEEGWKGKARGAPDASRVEAWRGWADERRRRRLTYWMRPWLERLGYDIQVPGPGRGERLLWAALRLPFSDQLGPRTRRLWQSARDAARRARTR